MNDFCQLFKEARDNTTITLERKRYDVFEEDCFSLKGYYCSNTASKEENSEGYRLSAIYLKDKKNITIDGNGATLMIHGVMTPVLLDGCDNVTIKNLTLDYFRPTMSEFTVLSNENGECVIKINKECLFDVRDNVLVWHGEIGKNGSYYWEHTYRNASTLSMYIDPETKQFTMAKGYPGDPRPSIPEFETIESLDENTLRVRLKIKDAVFPVGAVYQCRSIIRNQVGSFFQRCKNLTLQDLRICSMHGLGLLCQYCENVHYNNLNCLPKDGRTITSNADFFHFSGCKGKVLIENCRAAGAHDDFINAHGTYLRVQDISQTDKTALVRFMHSQSWGFEAFHAGDTIEFTRCRTLCGYARARVLRTERVNDTDIRLFLDKLPENAEVGKDAVENITWRPTLIVQNNYFGRSCAHGVLCSSAGKAIIQNNTFEKNLLGAVGYGVGCNSWYESGRPDKVIFRNNVVIACANGFRGDGASVLAVRPEILDEAFDGKVYKKLIVKNNVFKKSPVGAYEFDFRYIKRVCFIGNKFDKTYRLLKKHTGRITFFKNKFL